ncbi:hypothetical protein VTK56DRAFT_9933 [Thermocarpiscus australiensis]
MNRSIEQALLSLLPTHNSALPEPLTELASSLLAQSRHRASTLKAEEEIARPYACAHLACDRLKIALNLPPIDPRPPIPPRIYKRLYNHLDNILPAPASTPGRGTPGGAGAVLGSSRIRTPSSKLREQQLLGTSPLANKSRGPPSRATPSKDASLAQFRNRTSPIAPATPSAKSKRALTTTSKPKPATSSDPLPRWIRPTLRYLCAKLGPGRIGPVVAAGVESVVAPGGKRRTDDAWVLANLCAVLGALYLYVWGGVSWPGRDLDQSRYAQMRKEVASLLGRAREEVQVTEGGGEGEEEPWEGWREVGVKELDTAALRLNRHGCFEMDWVRGIEDLVEMEKREGGGEDEEVEEGATEPVHIWRADTMLQERYDYLSERKRKAYAEWKEGILKRIKELESGGTR